jgi:hypothetical protein
MTNMNIKPSACTNCGRINDSATHVGITEEKPRPGDFCICYRCQHVMVYDERLRLRELTDTEMIEIAGDPRLIRANNFLAEFKKQEEANEGPK